MSGERPAELLQLAVLTLCAQVREENRGSGAVGCPAGLNSRSSAAEG